MTKIPEKLLAFIDGENLVMRYQAMISDGALPQPGIPHVKDVYVWQPNALDEVHGNIFRASYYSSAIGDDDRLRELTKQIRALNYHILDVARDFHVGSFTCKLFKKQRQSIKSRAVDINITIDILKQVYANAADGIVLVTGDGDYLPLIREIMNAGKHVYLGALSSGLHPDLPIEVDGFWEMDGYFFKKK